MTKTFTRTGHLATIADASPVGAIMVRMESGDIDQIERGYAYFMMNMGAHGAVGVEEDNAIAAYLEQFDEIMMGEVA